MLMLNIADNIQDEYIIQLLNIADNIQDEYIRLLLNIADNIQVDCIMLISVNWWLVNDLIMSYWLSYIPLYGYDISPFHLFRRCLYTGNVQVFRNEGCLPSLVRVGVVALIRNTRGGRTLICYYYCFVPLLDFMLVLLNLSYCEADFELGIDVAMLFWSWDFAAWLLNRFDLLKD